MAFVVAALTWVAVHWITMIRVSAEWLGDIQVVFAESPAAQNASIFILAITEDTLATLPFRAPINRRFLAELLTALADKGVRAVGVDVLFDQPTNAADDALLRDTLESYDRPVVVAVGNDDSELTQRQRAFQAEYLSSIQTGVANLVKHDGTVRYTSIEQRVDDRYTRTFAAAIAASSGASLPERSERMVFRNTNSRQPYFRVYPAERVRLLPANWLNGKIALVGGILPNQDQHRTVLSALGGASSTTPGVIVHAYMLDQFLSGDGIPQLPAPLEWLLLVLVAGLGFLIINGRGHVAMKVLLATALLVTIWAGSYVSQQQGGPMLPLFALTLCLFLSLTVSWAYATREERAAKRFLRQAFTHYMSPNVIEDLVRNPEHLHLSGERRDMSFVFADLEAFTRLSEAVKPEALVGMLQDYQDGLVEIALKHGATIERFVGDATLIFFGAPLPQANHAERAVRCAVEWDRFCEQFRIRMHSTGMPVGMTRIGVHTGAAIVGNIGGRRRFAYTAHGDTVNVAARLESANKQFGTRVCMSEASAMHCPEFRFRPIGKVLLKGKEDPVEVVALGEGVPDAAYHKYMSAYELLATDDAAALEKFEALLGDYPQDGLVAYQVSRAKSGAGGSMIVLEEK